MTSEEARLDQAMSRGDDVLVQSLKREDEQRKRQRRVMMVGGLAAIVITTIIVNVVLWLVFVGPGKTQAKEAGPKQEMTAGEKQAKSEELTVEGWGLWQKGELFNARMQFRRAVQLNPRNVNALNGLGWTDFNMGSGDEAAEAWTKLLAMQPDHPAALNGMGQLYLSRGELDKAEPYLNKAAPQAPAAWWGLTKLYLLEGKFEEAEKWAQKIADGGDQNIKPLLDAAKAKKLPEELKQQFGIAVKSK